MSNREYKSDVFSMLLSEPDNALQVYNALNHSDYTDASMVEAKTLENGISLTVRNDAAFIVGTDINFYEHQSSYNPNMALRQLIYFAHTIESIVKSKSLFSHKRISIPFPHFVVFYNGTEKRRASETMRLSDHYSRKADESELELICTVYNINPGNNGELLEKCPVLGGYTQFVEKVRSNMEEMSDLDAVEAAIDSCIEERILSDFFIRRRDEVTKATMIDMTYETQMKYAIQEAKEEAMEEGIAKGRIDMMARMLMRGDAEDDLRRFFDATEEEIARAKKEANSVPVVR